VEETRRRQALVTAALGGRTAHPVQAARSRQASIEAALALGDRRVGKAVLAAYRAGQRLDGWSEWFDESRWLAAFADLEREEGVGLAWFAHRRRRLDEVLPWDRIDCGVTKVYLQKQLAAARNLAEVEDCVLAPCSVCGACDYDVVKNRTYQAKDYVPEPERAPRPTEPDVRTRVRIRWAKTGRLVAISHLETMHALLRAIRRAGLPTAFSQGYHPKPRVSFGPALPVGVESRCELADLDLLVCTTPERWPPGSPGSSGRAVRPGAEVLDRGPRRSGNRSGPFTTGPNSRWIRGTRRCCRRGWERSSPPGRRS